MLAIFNVRVRDFKGPIATRFLFAKIYEVEAFRGVAVTLSLLLPDGMMAKRNPIGLDSAAVRYHRETSRRFFNDESVRYDIGWESRFGPIGPHEYGGDEHNDE